MGCKKTDQPKVVIFAIFVFDRCGVVLLCCRITDIRTFSFNFFGTFQNHYIFLKFIQKLSAENFFLSNSRDKITFDADSPF